MRIHRVIESDPLKLVAHVGRSNGWMGGRAGSRGRISFLVAGGSVEAESNELQVGELLYEAEVQFTEVVESPEEFQVRGAHISERGRRTIRTLLTRGPSPAAEVPLPHLSIRR